MTGLPKSSKEEDQLKLYKKRRKLIEALRRKRKLWAWECQTCKKIIRQRSKPTEHEHPKALHPKGYKEWFVRVEVPRCQKSR